MTRETGLRQRVIFWPLMAKNLSLADKVLDFCDSAAILPLVSTTCDVKASPVTGKRYREHHSKA